MIQVAFEGGLGDVFIQMYRQPHYRFLQDYRGPARVVMATCNPHSHELFTNHPNAENLSVEHTLIKDRAYDKSGLWSSEVPSRDVLVEFYSDEPNFKPPYVVLAAGSSVNWKSIPSRCLPIILEACRGAGMPVIAVGRNYQNPIEGERYEPSVEGAGVVNMIDKLSVPAVAKLVQNASGVIAAHSAVCMLAWLENKPTFLVYSSEVKERNLDQDIGYSFGIGRQRNRNFLAEHVTAERVTEWLSP